MFHQSFDPFGRRFDAPLRRVEGSPRHKRKSLAKRLEEQERELMQLSFEELPFGLHEQRMNRERLTHQRNESCPHFLDQNDAVAVDEHSKISCPTIPPADAANTSLNSCPETLSASGPCDDGDHNLLDSPMTYPPRTVVVRPGDIYAVATPKMKNSMHRKRLFSLGDYSTICSDPNNDDDDDNEEEEECISIKDDPTADAPSFNQDDFDVWEVQSFGSAVTYPPRTITLTESKVDVIATPRRPRTHRTYSDLSSSTCTKTVKHLPSLPNLETHDEYYEPLYKYDLYDDTVDQDEDQIPHVMSSPNFFADDDDEDDNSDFPYAELNGIRTQLCSDEGGSCPGRTSTWSTQS
jgi:hypothetical protein